MKFPCMAGWLIVTLLALSTITLAGDPPPVSPPEMMSDAELTSVTFIDADTGWAVGDRGVIWHTGDGGRHWQQQASPVSCRLEHVQFLDAQQGWAVGGWPHPFSDRSTGVVLKTEDGGQVWQMVPGLTLPTLRYVQFSSAQRGVAVGDSSPLFPGGVFLTADGGRSWRAMPSPVPQAWLTGLFTADNQGLLISPAGDVAMTNSLEVRPARLPQLKQRRPTGIAMSSSGTLWIAGDAGLLMQSHDRGSSWQINEAAQQLAGAGQLDFRAIATHGTHLWLAGNPGSLIWHSADEGRTWETLVTEQPLPICDLHFSDENRGWAVGSFGLILATRDGGRSWRVQRQGGSRAALLAVATDMEQLPKELLAHLAGNEAYLTAVEIMCEREAEGITDPLQRQRLQSASSALGVAVANGNAGFPLDGERECTSANPIMAKWEERSGADPLGRLQERIVRRIRQWRPDVLLVEPASPLGEEPLSHLVNQITLAAAQQAGDAKLYPEHVRHLGLPAWKVKKVIATRRGTGAGTITLTRTQLSTRLGCSLADAADLATGYCDLSPDYSRAGQNASQLGFELLIDQLPQGQGRRDFFSGIPLTPGGEARRAFSAPTTIDLSQLARRVQQRQTLQKLFERLENDPPRGATWLAQVTDLTRDMPPENATRAMERLARNYARAGEWKLAAEAWQYLLDRYPQQPLADVAATWLVHHHGSAEHALLIQQRESLVTAAVARDAGSPSAFIRQTSGTAGRTSLVEQDRTLMAASLARQQEAKRPLWFAEPAHPFALAHAMRCRGNHEAALKLWQGLAGAVEVETAWSLCAATEIWLEKQEGECPKPVVPAIRSGSKPHLDGRLDDPCWQQARPAAIGSEAQAAFAWDDEFLYLALSCRRLPGVDYPAEAKVRQRDEKLARQDRVAICFDIDRDYATYFQFAVDHRGRTWDSCDEDVDWNPQWYVASGGDAEVWTIEAAIAWKDGLPVPAGENAIWAMGVQRHIPNQPLASFSRPARSDIQPEGFGLLMFQSDKSNREDTVGSKDDIQTSPDEAGPTGK